MSQFADIRVEWRVADIERNLQRKADSHEVSTLRSDVDSLECTNRQLSSEVTVLRTELQTLQDSIRTLQDQINELMPELS